MSEQDGRFRDEDGVLLLINDRDDVVYLMASGVEQSPSFDEGSDPIEVGPRRVVGLRLSAANLLDLSATLHAAVCPDCSEMGRVRKRARTRSAHAKMIAICQKYAKEHPEHSVAAGQIAMRIAQEARKK